MPNFKLRRVLVAALVLVLVLIGYSVLAVRRSTPAVALSVGAVPVAATQAAAAISWPSSGQSSLAVTGTPLKLSHGTQTPSPTASVAKVVTALQVLSVKPLTGAEAGPSITITQADVDDYNDYVAVDGSVAAVQVGEQLTERQALEALMLPSANNVADTLARWAFGSVAGYVTKANAAVAKLGMTHTHIADPSGFSADTVSTADDLVVLGRAALANSALSAIFAEKTAVLPVAGEVSNVNTALGQDGIFGIKTGNTDQAGGVFLFAAHITPAGQTKTFTLVAAVMAVPDLPTALADAVPIIDSVRSGFISSAERITANEPVAAVKTSWGQQVTASPSRTSVPLLRFPGVKVSVAVNVNTAKATLTQGDTVGAVQLNSGFGTASVPVVVDNTPKAPASWKLLHP